MMIVGKTTFRRKIEVAFVVSFAIFLAACSGTTAISTSNSTTKYLAGISLDSPTASKNASKQNTDLRLNVAVVLFDPNFPKDSDDFDRRLVWPEVRRAEAIRFAVTLQDEIEKTNKFESARIVPDFRVSADLFVHGKIIKTTGKVVKISVQVHDISGARWMKKKYKLRVKYHEWENVNSYRTDPYRPMFNRVAQDIVKKLKKKKTTDLAHLRAISELQFANVFAPEAFAQHLEFKKKRIALVSLPAVDDPTLVRIRALRILDYQFMDNMQNHYGDFARKTNASYVAWQLHSILERDAMIQAKLKSLKAIFDAAKIASDVAVQNMQEQSQYLQPMTITPNYYDPYPIDTYSNIPNYTTMPTVTMQSYSYQNINNSNASRNTAAYEIGQLLQESFAASAAGRRHRDNLVSLGRTLDFEITPQVIKVEESVHTLRGGQISQYRQWRQFLKYLYSREETPDVQL